MKLLVITMLYEPDCVGIAAIATDMCHALAERGHEVTVYTTYPYYPEWKRKCRANAWRIQDETIENVQVRRHGLYIPRHPSRLFPRLLHELSFPVSLLRSLFDRRRYDLVMVFCPLMGSVAFAGLRKWLHGEPLWINVQDIPADAGLNTGIHRSEVFHQLGSLAQKLLLGRGDVWSTISPPMVARLAAIRPRRSTIHLCPNWLVGSLAQQIEQCASKIGRPTQCPPRLLYCGTIGKKQGLLRCCKELSALDFDFRFQVRGTGSEAGAVQNWIEHQQDDRFVFGPLLPEAEFVRAIHDADWYLIPEMAGAGPSFLSSKLIPAISLATPILALCDGTGPLGCEVRQHALGVTLEWSQLAELPDRLRYFNENAEEYACLQRSCTVRAHEYNRGAAIDRLEGLLQQAVGVHDGMRRKDALHDRARSTRGTTVACPPELR